MSCVGSVLYTQNPVLVATLKHATEFKRKGGGKEGSKKKRKKKKKNNNKSVHEPTQQIRKETKQRLLEKTDRQKSR